MAKPCTAHADLESTLTKLANQTITIAANQKLMMRSLDAMTSILVKQGLHEEQIKKCEEGKAEIWAHIDEIKKDISKIRSVVAVNQSKADSILTREIRNPGLIITGVIALMALATFVYNLK